MSAAVRRQRPGELVVVFHLEIHGPSFTQQFHLPRAVRQCLRKTTHHIGQSIDRRNMRGIRGDQQESATRQNRVRRQRVFVSTGNPPAGEVFEVRLRVVKFDKLPVASIRSVGRMIHYFADDDGRPPAGGTGRLDPLGKRSDPIGFTDVGEVGKQGPGGGGSIPAGDGESDQSIGQADRVRSQRGPGQTIVAGEPGEEISVATETKPGDGEVGRKETRLLSEGSGPGPEGKVGPGGRGGGQRCRERGAGLQAFPHHQPGPGQRVSVVETSHPDLEVEVVGQDCRRQMELVGPLTNPGSGTIDAYERALDHGGPGHRGAAHVGRIQSRRIEGCGREAEGAQQGPGLNGQE